MWTRHSTNSFRGYSWRPIWRRKASHWISSRIPSKCCTNNWQHSRWMSLNSSSSKELSRILILKKHSRFYRIISAAKVIIIWWRVSKQGCCSRMERWCRERMTHCLECRALVGKPRKVSQGWSRDNTIMRSSPLRCQKWLTNRQRLIATRSVSII